MSTTPATETDAAVAPIDLEQARTAVQHKVLWLATAMVDAANRRDNPSGVKVGGHQASSASSVGILVALYLETLGYGDRVAVKPHASPVLHALQFLLGQLDPAYLPMLRAFGGLQAYPSATKDPGHVDYSTGSVGLGVAATAFGALVRDYLRTHRLEPDSERFFAHLGDAELDEGVVWETVAETALADVVGIVWIVDVNRQSLDRVVPGIRIARYREMFRAAGWATIDAKYGRQLQARFRRPGGQALRDCIDGMPNETYQAIISRPAELLRQRLLDAAPDPRGVSEAIDGLDDETLRAELSDLGGHDVGALVEAYRQAIEQDRPTVVFAYTIKGWGLPIAGDPLNHSALLDTAQLGELAASLGENPERPWSTFPAGSPAARYCDAARQRLYGQGRLHRAAPAFEPRDVELSVPAVASTQSLLARVLRAVDRASPDIGRRIVTVSPDVATSTNLGGWINRVGVWSSSPRPDVLGFEDRLLKWRERPSGRHIELGIAENGMFLLLGQLGLSERLSGRRLVPIGTVYDPFICRGLDALLYALYEESRFILIGTPSGVSLAPEGGAHQSIVTPSLGIELPNLVSYEPCFGRDLLWLLTDAITDLASGKGPARYFRLSTRPIDQSLYGTPGPTEEAYRRHGAMAGAYRLRQAAPDAEHVVHLFAIGPTVPEALAARQLLADEGVDANVFVVTSPDLLYRAARSATISAIDRARHLSDPLDLLTRDERRHPIVTVLDGHPHALAFLGSALGCPSAHLGVDGFGQSGLPADLYRHFRIDAESIVNVAIGLLDRDEGE